MTTRTPATEDFANLLNIVQAAVTNQVDLLQIREKNLSANALYQLSVSAARLTRGSATKLLINDRADIAAAAGADGVHLTTNSLPTGAIRQTFGDEFVIGVSTHSVTDALAASRSGADFIVFGPVFETASKSNYGPAQGLEELARVCAELAPFPVLALGGITTGNAADCIRVGAQGVAGIGMFGDPAKLTEVAHAILKNKN